MPITPPLAGAELVSSPRALHKLDKLELTFTCSARSIAKITAAVRQFKRLRAAARKLIKETIGESLSEQDPTEEARNRFRLRRISEDKEMFF
jgi:hypothetical protein